MVWYEKGVRKLQDAPNAKDKNKAVGGIFKLRLIAETIGKTMARAATLVTKEVSKKVMLKMAKITNIGFHPAIPFSKELETISAAPELTIAFPIDKEEANIINKSRFIFFLILSKSDIPKRT